MKNVLQVSVRHKRHGGTETNSSPCLRVSVWDPLFNRMTARSVRQGEGCSAS